MAVSLYASSSADYRSYVTTDENVPWHPTKIQQDRRGMIWIGSWNGLYRFDGYDFLPFKPKPGQGTGITTDRIRDILMVGGDTLLCRFDERVFSFDIITCTFDTLPDSQQADLLQRMTDASHLLTPAQTLQFGQHSFDNIQQHFIDQQGCHWLMGHDNIHCVQSPQRHGTLVDVLPADDLTRCLYLDSQGIYWLCSRDNQHVILFDSQWQLLGYLGRDGRLHQSPTAFAPIYCIYDDGDGQLWLGSKPDGMYRLRRQGDDSFAIQHMPMSDRAGAMPTDAVYDIQPDQQGRLWLASWNHGLICLHNPQASNPDEFQFTTLSTYCVNYPAEAAHLRRIYILSDGTLLATSTRGLFIIDDISQPLQQLTMRLHQRERDRSQSLMTSATMAVAFDANNHMFVATESGGVCLLTSPDLHAPELDFHHYTMMDGLMSDVTFNFVQSPDGRMLVICPNGISAIDIDNGNIESFGRQFWNAPTPFTECTPYIIGDTLLVMAHEAGIITQPLRELSHQGFKPYIALTAVTIGTEPTRYDMDGQNLITLSPTQRNLEIDFAAIDYNSDHLRYRTRLTPEDETPMAWSRANSSHEVVLQDLKPGTYQFQIRSSNYAGQWPDNVRTLTVVVQPRFFQSWYGQLLLWLIFAIIIAAITSTIIYIRRLDNKRHELLQTYLALLESTTHDKIAMAKSTDTAATTTTTAASDNTYMPADDIHEADTATAIPQPHNLTAAERQFMQRLIDYVEKNIGNSNASLADMAEATATSKSSLTRRTHQLLGVTPADFLKEARLKHACQLLRTTTSSLSEIAFACGFSDPKYFSKCFKASTGKTPTEYRM